jgi:hypothetical protein
MLQLIALLFELVNVIKFAVFAILNKPFEMVFFFSLALIQKAIRECFVP